MSKTSQIILGVDHADHYLIEHVTVAVSDFGPSIKFCRSLFYWMSHKKWTKFDRPLLLHGIYGPLRCVHFYKSTEIQGKPLNHGKSGRPLNLVTYNFCTNPQCKAPQKPSKVSKCSSVHTTQTMTCPKTHFSSIWKNAKARTKIHTFNAQTILWINIKSKSNSLENFANVKLMWFRMSQMPRVVQKRKITHRSVTKAWKSEQFVGRFICKHVKDVDPAK